MREPTGQPATTRTWMGGPALTEVHAWPVILAGAFLAGFFFLAVVLAASTGPTDFERCLDRADSGPGEAACAQRFPEERP